MADAKRGRRRCRGNPARMGDLPDAHDQSSQPRQRVWSDSRRCAAEILDRRSVRSGVRRHPARVLADRWLDRPLYRRRRAEPAQRLDRPSGRRAARDPDGQAAGLRLRGRDRRAGPGPAHEAGVLMKGLPLLSIMMWAPFVSAVIIMFFARHRPLLVRLTALVGASISLVASVWLYYAYDRGAAGFQFQEQFSLVPSLGINYMLALDGMSALLCLLTSIIIFGGVFASWTVKERGQEFYALLLLLVTGVYGVFVSLDLFVFFLFYEIAVLPMYLLIGIWGSSGFVKPQGIFGTAMGRTGVGTKEYAAMKLTLYLLFGSAFILVGILALYVGAGQQSFSFLTMAG